MRSSPSILVVFVAVLASGALAAGCRGADQFHREGVNEGDAAGQVDVGAGGSGGAGGAPTGGGGGGGGVDAAIDQAPDLVRDGGGGARDGAAGDGGALPGDAGPDAPASDAADGPPKLGEGLACTAASQCGSGFCVDGVCCNSSCTGTCQTCVRTLRFGQCLPADPGTDPRSECEEEEPSSCGYDGTCDGAGGCRRHPAGLSCRPPSCAGSTFSLEASCNGAGACVASGTLSCAPFACGTDGRCRTTCAADGECAAPSTCNTTGGTCGKQPLGGACATTDDCFGGTCQQGVCCSTACTGACMSCAVPGRAGLCSPVPAGVDPLDQCADDGAASCGHDGTCDGAGACRSYAAGAVCRPPSGDCDRAESCPGGGGACPADALAAPGTGCRAAAGACDAPEVCDGSGPACPADLRRAAGSACRAVAGACDVAEACDGVAAACPDDAFVAAGTACRPSAGVCDVAEACPGTAAACPTDGFVATGTACREAIDLCDRAEACTGAAAGCPADGVQPQGTSCRASTAACDAPELCGGTLATCPADTGVVTPLPPAGLTATASGGRVALTWAASAGATGYDVKRATTAGGPYTLVASPAGTAYADTGVSNGTTYFYVVAAAVNGALCPSADSAEVTATPLGCQGVYCDDFESDTAGATPAGWTRAGGSSGDWTVFMDTSKVLRQGNSVSSTLRLWFTSGAPGAPWSGATSVTAQVKPLATGSSNQAAMVCLRYTTTSNYYCAALLTSGVQIQTRVGGTAANSATFAAPVAIGTSYAVKLSVDAAGVLSAYLAGTLMGTYTPSATLASGYAAVATASMQASFDDVVVSQP